VIISKAKLILNKLSVTNFDKLSDQFMTGTYLLFFILIVFDWQNVIGFTSSMAWKCISSFYLPSSHTQSPYLSFFSLSFFLTSSYLNLFFFFDDLNLFFSVGVDSVELMGRAIDLIVLCAQMNEHFSFMYAELCKKITDKWSSGTADEVGTALLTVLSSATVLLFSPLLLSIHSTTDTPTL
jgi:hypothetical protein